MDNDALLDAMWQLLDDMGPKGLCVCQAAKSQAMEAYRLATHLEPMDEMPSAFTSKEGE